MEPHLSQTLTDKEMCTPFYRHGQDFFQLYFIFHYIYETSNVTKKIDILNIYSTSQTLSGKTKHSISVAVM